MSSYLNLGIDPNKLILGVPFYGYNYSCFMQQMESPNSKYCPISFDTFRGVNCSDAAGNEKSFAKINALIDQGFNITQIRWDQSMQAPYFNYINSTQQQQPQQPQQQVFQVWFDDPKSLQIKYNYAKNLDLRGVGPFCFTQLYDSFSDNEMTRAERMWSAFDAFFL